MIVFHIFRFFLAQIDIGKIKFKILCYLSFDSNRIRILEESNSIIFFCIFEIPFSRINIAQWRSAKLLIFEFS